jgi:tRNA(Ile)-lysidine synthetase-like protein
MSDVVAEIVDQIRDSLEHVCHPLDRPLVVGLSGGVDSQVLTHALLQVAADSGHELQAIHVDHGLRRESQDDAERVQQICKSWGLMCDVVKVDVSSWDSVLHQGTESAARNARYAALARVAIENETDTIATGHTLDDQIETILLRLLAGTGLEGLSGMREKIRRFIPLDPGRPPLRRFVIFRPLLSVSRAQVEEYASVVGIEPVEDETNVSLAYRRNAIRRTVVPALEAIEPSVRESVARTAGLLQDDVSFISDVVDATYEDVVAQRAGLWMLERQQFRAAHAAIQRRILHRVVEPLLSAKSRLSLERIEALRLAAVEGHPGKVIELADSVVAYIDYARVAIGDASALEDDLRRLSWVPLLEPGTNVPLRGDVDVWLANGWRIRGHVPDDVDLTLRTRREGDRTRDDRSREVKLQDWFVNHKVPRYLRDWLPLVARESEIDWVIGLDVMEFPSSRGGVQLHLELEMSGRTTSE